MASISHTWSQRYLIIFQTVISIVQNLDNYGTTSHNFINCMQLNDEYDFYLNINQSALLLQYKPSFRWQYL